MAEEKGANVNEEVALQVLKVLEEGRGTPKDLTGLITKEATFACASLPEMSSVVAYGAFVAGLKAGPCPDYALRSVEKVWSDGDFVHVVTSYSLSHTRPSGPVAAASPARSFSGRALYTFRLEQPSSAASASASSSQPLPGEGRPKVSSLEKVWDVAGLFLALGWPLMVPKTRN